MAMVIMSPLSELTDTDGFEMHSASQWAAIPPVPHRALGLSGPSVHGVGLQWSDGKAKFNSAASQQLSEAQSRQGGFSTALLDPFWWKATHLNPDLCFSHTNTHTTLLFFHLL